jgi:hypothetical protein
VRADICEWGILEFSKSSHPFRQMTKIGRKMYPQKKNVSTALAINRDTRHIICHARE